MAKKNLVNVEGEYSFPRGFTISDNRIEDCLQRHISPAAYNIWRQYLRFWGGEKKTAYPSLALLSERTGLSEKTIRKCNKELVEKGYLRYTSGNSKRANSYYYVSIDELVKKYETQENVGQESPQNSGTEGDNLPPIKEHNKEQSNKITKRLKDLSELDRSVVKAFLDEFQIAYKNQYGIKYPLEDRDAKTVIANLEDVKNSFINYRQLIPQFMRSRNKFIEESDHSVFFFFRPQVMKTIIAEFGQTDIGRWVQQAQKAINEIESHTKGMSKNRLERYLDEVMRIYLSGASKSRDEFVEEYIRDHFKAK